MLSNTLALIAELLSVELLGRSKTDPTYARLRALRRATMKILLEADRRAQHDTASTSTVGRGA